MATKNLTQEDLDLQPELVEQGYKVGDEYSDPEESENDDEGNDESGAHTNDVIGDGTRPPKGPK